MKKNTPRSLKAAADEVHLSPDVLVRFIALRWVIPADDNNVFEESSLDDEDIARVRLIWQLQREFGVNDEAVPIILHLIDQLNRTHLEARDRNAP